MVKVKVKFTLERIMKAHRWNGGTAPTFNLSATWVRVAPATLPPGKKSCKHCTVV